MTYTAVTSLEREREKVKQNRTAAILQIVGLVLLCLGVLAQLVAAGIDVSVGVSPDISSLTGSGVPALIALVTLYTLKGRARRVAFRFACVYAVLGLVYLALVGWAR